MSVSITRRPVAVDIGTGRVETRFTGMINKITLEVSEVE